MTKRAAQLTTTPKDATDDHNPGTLHQLRIGHELVDTTWRISVPVLLFAGIGIFADRSLGTKPWLTLLGMAIGFVGAGLLVRRQLKRWPDMPVRPGSYERNRKAGDNEDKDYYSD